MRLRKIKNAKEIIEQNNDLVLLEPNQYKGKWQDVFQTDHPIHLEVGMGKGQFLYEMALKHPNINFIGLEVVPSVLIRAIEKYEDNRLPNVRLLWLNATELTDVFNNGEVDRIYLNFSDPWPKNRHEKRRLTYKNFLSIFKEILTPAGAIHFKTDNQGLFEYSIQSMSQFGMYFKFISLDLHNSDFEGNVMTEYEERFVELKQRIYRLEAQFHIKDDSSN